MKVEYVQLFYNYIDEVKKKLKYTTIQFLNFHLIESI